MMDVLALKFAHDSFFYLPTLLSLTPPATIISCLIKSHTVAGAAIATTRLPSPNQQMGSVI